MMISTKRSLAFAITLILLLERGSSSSFSSCGSAVGCFIGSNTKKSHAIAKRKFPKCPLPVIESQAASTTYNNSPLHYLQRNDVKSTTSLSMGIRSFLRIGQGGKGNDESKSDNPEDIKAALEAIKADLEAVEKLERGERDRKKREKITKDKIRNAIPTPDNASVNSQFKGTGTSTATTNTRMTSRRNGQTEVKTSSPISTTRSSTPSRPSSPPRSSKNDASKSSSTYAESVHERINRFKHGEMTDEEKLIFLNNALTSPSKKGPTIRQPIPDSRGSKKTVSNSKSSLNNAKYDPLWSHVVGGKKPSNDSSGRSRYNIQDVVSNDSAKKQYLDMVTDPNRFASYAAMGGYKKEEKEPVEETYEYKDEEIKKPETPKGGVIDNLKNIFQESEDSLAARLQSAAILKEQKDREIKLAKEQQRQAERDRIAETQRKAAEDIRKREAELLAKKQAEAENLSKAEQERADAEKARQEALLAAQEEYWAKKLEKDKKKQVNTGSRVDQVKKAEAERIAKAVQDFERDSYLNKIRDEQQARENPHESQILQEAADDLLHEQEKNANIIEESSAKTSHTVPQPRQEDASTQGFVKEQERKKAELDKLVEEQKARLASLNSPLPSQTEFPKVTNVNVTPAPVSTPPAVVPREPVAPPSNEPAPRLSLAELTMKKSKPAANNGVNKEEKTAPVAASNPPPLPSLREMTMLNKPRSSTPIISNNVSKSPIRQTIQDDDDEEDDFFEFTRNGNNKNLSIKDIMAQNDGGNSSGDDSKETARQKSKMWGIDIDKFDL